MFFLFFYLHYGIFQFYNLLFLYYFNLFCFRDNSIKEDHTRETLGDFVPLSACIFFFLIADLFLDMYLALLLSLF